MQTSRWADKQYTDPKQCEQCGTEFKVLLAYRHGNEWIKRGGAIRKQVYCSTDCREKARYQRIREKKLAYNKERYYEYKRNMQAEGRWVDAQN